MEPTTFKMRRVLMGVVVGMLLVGLAFYGWAQYRQQQYHQRESAVLAGYRHESALCARAGNMAGHCADRVLAACLDDPFWQTSKPFDAAAALPDPAAPCQEATAAP